MSRFLLLLLIASTFNFETVLLASKTKIDRIQIFSERCSGSNFITSLLINHYKFKNVKIVDENYTEDLLPIIRKKKCTFQQIYINEAFDDSYIYKLLVYPYGHKHFSPWYFRSYPPEPRFNYFYQLDNSDDCIFIVVFRNAYDWARSLHHSPWHSDSSLKKLSFSNFIRARWALDMQEETVQEVYQYNPLVDLDPFTGQHFSNIIKMRTAKIANMLKLKKLVKNIFFVRYEDVLANPTKFLDHLQNLYDLELDPFPKICTSYKGDAQQGKYKKKKYPPISRQDLDYINSQLDSNIESKIGYHLITNINDLN